MHWNEKIDLIKKRYSDNDFSVPHLDRKGILRKIETKFISRAADYYDLNNSNVRFSNWWENISSTNEKSLEIKLLLDELNKSIDKNDRFWIAGEFSQGVMIYKVNKDAAIELISIGKTWTDTFHLVHLKFEYMISIQFESELIKIRKATSN